MSVLIWILLISLVAGVVARLVAPGPSTPKGFVFTVLLGLAGALLATAVGHLTGIYHAGRGAGFIGASVGAIVILFIWHRLVVLGHIRDHGL